MSLVDLLVTILVATILITVGIGLMTYLVYKLRYARVRGGDGEAGEDGGRYFVPYAPPGSDGEETRGGEEAAEEARGP
ncbi:MAG: hypothetical protein Q8W44_13765 [Candidatus Palauibacterales bacterium]|nr:hypothetical protein [Candidatus Palauibacterales bacterium]